MVIASVDVSTSAKKAKRAERKSALQKQLSSSSEPCSSQDIEAVTSDSSTESDANSEYTPSSSTQRRLEKKKGVPSVSLEAVALISDKTGVSDRATASLASAVLEGSNLIKKGCTALIVDKNKIRRARKRIRKQLQHEPKVIEKFCSLYFDGRKDLTKTHDDKTKHVKTVREEHVSLLQEPESRYIGHITPANGSAKCLAASISEFFESNQIDMTDIIAIGCDGTAVNTGNKGGVIALLEEKMQKPVHWFICLLHGNELPLRHLMQFIDGKTSGPSSFTGPIGRKLIDCETLPVIAFKAIPSESIEVDIDVLSTDQKYLLNIYGAVSSGTCSDDIAAMNPGNMHHARWLTTANRLLRFYIATPKPTEGLLILVQFIMKVYVPVWFAVKCNPSVTQGAKHLFKMMKESRFLPNKFKVVIEKVIQHNGYFGHPENLLLSMINDDSPVVRELGLRRIIKAREINKNAPLRMFELPKLRFDANHYYEMIDWQTIKLSEPPMTMALATSEIQEAINSEQKKLSLTVDFPNHTQAVERVIKLVTEAASSVVGEEARDGLIRARIEGRKKLPKFESKKHYQLD